MFKIDIKGIKKATPKERQIFKQAAKRLEILLNLDSFWVEVENHYPYWENKNYYTFEAFKNYFLSGADNFNKEIDRDLDLYVTFYYSFKSVVGYTHPSTYWTWINRRIFKNNSIGQIAGNICHEYCHNLGFGHPNTNRKSLTYQFGYLVADIIDKKSAKTIEDKYLKKSVWARIKSFFSKIF